MKRLRTAALGLLSAVVSTAAAGVASADVIISNLVTGAAAGSVFGAGTATQFRAFGFTMGNEAYTLEEVVLAMNFPQANPMPLVSIWSDNGGVPGTQLYVLTTPGGLTGSVDVVFTATGMPRLDANTTYWLYVESSPTSAPSFRWAGSAPNTTPTGVATAVGYQTSPPTTSAAQERLEIVGTPVGGGLGTVYCAPAVANSTGAPGELAALGSAVASDDDLTLDASSLPANAFGYYLTSQTQGMVPNPGGSQGVLCLGGSIGRYIGPGQIQNSGPGGAFSLSPSLTMTPQPTGFVSIMAGETWNFQVWYRDDVGGQPTSNFTSAVSIAFQ